MCRAGCCAGPADGVCSEIPAWIHTIHPACLGEAGPIFHILKLEFYQVDRIGYKSVDPGMHKIGLQRGLALDFEILIHFAFDFLAAEPHLQTVEPSLDGIVIYAPQPAENVAHLEILRRIKPGVDDQTFFRYLLAQKLQFDNRSGLFIVCITHKNIRPVEILLAFREFYRRGLLTEKRNRETPGKQDHDDHRDQTG